MSLKEAVTWHVFQLFGCTGNTAGISFKHCKANGMPIKFNVTEMQMARKRIRAFSIFCPLPLLEKKDLSRGTWKQGKLALASHLHPHIGLNAKEEFGINLPALVQREAYTVFTKMLKVYVQIRACTLTCWLEIHSLPVCRAQVSVTKYIARDRNRFPWLITENRRNEANIECKCFINAYICNNIGTGMGHFVRLTAQLGWTVLGYTSNNYYLSNDH